EYQCKTWDTRSFFFQAEDGIRDRNVTGVQTCALPILNTRPSVTSPTGTVIGEPVFSTSAPRRKPSVELIAIVLTTLSPRCNAVSDRKSTRLNSSHVSISYAVFCLKKKK